MVLRHRASAGCWPLDGQQVSKRASFAVRKMPFYAVICALLQAIERLLRYCWYMPPNAGERQRHGCEVGVGWRKEFPPVLRHVATQPVGTLGRSVRVMPWTDSRWRFAWYPLAVFIVTRTLWPSVPTSGWALSTVMRPDIFTAGSAKTLYRTHV